MPASTLLVVRSLTLKHNYSRGLEHTLLALAVFEELHALEGSTASNEFVGEFGLVVIATAAVDLLVSVTTFV